MSSFLDRYLGSITLFILVILPIVFILGLSAWLLRKARKEKKEQEAWRSSMEALAAHRRKWLSEHSVTLYYNDVDGIYAVLTPEHYERVKEITKHLRACKCWKSNTSLKCSPKTVLFLKHRGIEKLQQLGADPLHEYRVPISQYFDTKVGIVQAFLISQLRQLEKEYRITLEKKDDIFVPFVNETLIPFRSQQIILHRNEIDLYRDLVEAQIPKNLLLTPA